MSELEELKSEIEELRKQQKILANALLNHLKGNLTIQDIEMCAQAMMRVRKALQAMPTSGPAGGGSLEAIIAQHLMNARQKEKTEIEDIPLDELEKIRKEVTKDDRGKSKED
jgi:hypothetical protein|uniref:Uncharacterized protein n=1 Tax=Candidatus Aramenus sulfurataquae TaxID=1326980 RepID=A0A0F2LSE7_9CREN|nr:hypothetical protein [Candidatus Aramenus sulfurataquae]